MGFAIRIEFFNKIKSVKRVKFSKNSILSALAKSVKLRANIYLAFKEFFGGFFVSIRH
ncbi:putative restriction endonuclease [Helicobacter pylori Sat464]|nr:putative restriction endonuclease [Helicobacter pylori Sat464]